ncbi:MAG: hypothetical protein QOF74_4638 [Caballeronia mineralivorans]|jgi:hypothetical protein|nr:hypothetical protein [Caballeronia mineralivorans]
MSLDISIRAYVIWITFVAMGRKALGTHAQSVQAQHSIVKF